MIYLLIALGMAFLLILAVDVRQKRTSYLAKMSSPKESVNAHSRHQR